MQACLQAATILLVSNIEFTEILLKLKNKTIFKFQQRIVKAIIIRSLWFWVGIRSTLVLTQQLTSNRIHYKVAKRKYCTEQQEHTITFFKSRFVVCSPSPMTT